MMERIIGFAICCLFIAFLGMLEWLVCRDIDKRFWQKQSDRERQVQTGTCIESLVGEYCDWLRHNTTVEMIESNCVMITTPFLDRHNDAIQIYCQKKGEHSLLLSDDRYALDDLKMSGCNIFESPKRLVVMQQILNGFGVTLNDGALEVETDFAEFPKAKHRLVQAIIVISNLQGDATNEQTHNK